MSLAIRRNAKTISALSAFVAAVTTVVLMANHMNKHEVSFIERGAAIEEHEQRLQHRRLKKETAYVDSPLNEKPISNLKSIGDFPVDTSDIPFFWWAPLAGCAKAEDIIRECNLFQDVDTSSQEGLAELSGMNIMDNLTSDVIVSPHLKDVAGVFDFNHHGRAFTFIRNPIKRELAHYHYLKDKDSSHVDYHAALSGMTLEGYVNSDYASNNWLTRHLLGKVDETIVQEDLEVAKAILREKVLILLVEDTDEVVSQRLRHYFGSSGKDMGSTWDCIGNLVKDRYDNFDFPELKKNTHEYSMLTRNNNFDIKLYRYAQYLYEHQRIMMERKEDEHYQGLILDMFKAQQNNKAAVEYAQATLGKTAREN